MVRNAAGVGDKLSKFLDVAPPRIDRKTKLKIIWDPSASLSDGTVDEMESWVKRITPRLPRGIGENWLDECIEQLPGRMTSVQAQWSSLGVALQKVGLKHLGSRMHELARLESQLAERLVEVPRFGAERYRRLLDNPLSAHLSQACDEWCDLRRESEGAPLGWQYSELVRSRAYRIWIWHCRISAIMDCLAALERDLLGDLGGPDEMQQQRTLVGGVLPTIDRGTITPPVKRLLRHWQTRLGEQEGRRMSVRRLAAQYMPGKHDEESKERLYKRWASGRGSPPSADSIRGFLEQALPGEHLASLRFDALLQFRIARLFTFLVRSVKAVGPAISDDRIVAMFETFRVHQVLQRSGLRK